MEGTHGSLFATCIVSIIIEVAWVVTMSFLMFFLLKVLKIFRVPPEDEDIGLDNSKHGGSAYTHDLPSEMATLNTGGEASKDAGRA